MSSQFTRNAIRFGGVGSALFAVVALVGFVVFVGSAKIADASQDTAYFIPAGAALMSSVLLGVALVGAWALQRDSLSPAGNWAFAFALVGTILAAGAQWTYVFVVPYVAEAAADLVNEGQGILLAGFLISYATLAFGWISFGLAMLHARSAPRWVCLLIIAGAAISFLPLPSRTLVRLSEWRFSDATWAGARNR